MKLNIFKSTVVSIEEDSYCVKKLVLLSFLSAMVICVKFLLGNIVGVELVSFLLCLYTLYFSLRDSIFIVTIFNLAIMLLYGFSAWNLVYWLIFPFDVLVIKILKKQINNRYSFGVIVGTLSFLIMFWYFLSDLLFFDLTYAVGGLISALPMALMGFVTNFLVALWLFNPLNKLFNANMRLMSQNYLSVNIKDNINVISAFLTVTFSVSIFVIISLIMLNNHQFIKWSQNVKNILTNDKSLNNSYDYAFKQGILTSEDYFTFYHSLAPNECGIVAIYDENNIFKARINNCSENYKTLQNIIFDKNIMTTPDQFYFNDVSSKFKKHYGRFIGDLWALKAGKWQKINSGNTCPFIFTKDIKSAYGVMDTELKNKEIYQLSYNYNNEEKFLEGKCYY
ncbi:MULTISPECIES: hypothetical protein [unclassified Spiroplasma]|uniref:hypothetical protein n=1 Tax=unclassified Spiroplasma TaxID=2637901 RepID=UPI00313E8421